MIWIFELIYKIEINICCEQLNLVWDPSYCQVTCQSGPILSCAAISALCSLQTDDTICYSIYYTVQHENRIREAITIPSSVWNTDLYLNRSSSTCLHLHYQAHAITQNTILSSSGDPCIHRIISAWSARGSIMNGVIMNWHQGCHGHGQWNR